MAGAREAILREAMDLFARKGYAAASTREICEAAGITKPVLYYHFRSKEHLYQELMIDCFSHYRKTLLRASQTRGSIRERLVRMVYTDFQATREDPSRIRFLLRMIFSPEERHPRFDFVREMEEQRRIIAGVLEEGGRSGRSDGTASELASALMGMQLFAILENLFTGRSTLTRRRAEMFVDLLLGGRTAA